MGWHEFLFKCEHSRAIVRQRILITLIINQGINVTTEHICRIQNESELAFRKFLILIIQILQRLQ
jgi:hypothetical protein